eukprot:s1324_g12.t1
MPKVARDVVKSGRLFLEGDDCEPAAAAAAAATAAVLEEEPELWIMVNDTSEDVVPHSLLAAGESKDPSRASLAPLAPGEVATALPRRSKRRLRDGFYGRLECFELKELSPAERFNSVSHFARSCTWCSSSSWRQWHGHRGMFGRQKEILRAGDRVCAHFQNSHGAKSQATDVGTLLQFTTSEAEVQFDDGATQFISKTWVVERLAAWELDLAPGDVVYSHYASGKGRTSNTDLGVVVSLLDGGKVRIRFQDQIIQTVPQGWVEQVMRLDPGDRVNAFFKVNGGRARGAKSMKADMGSVLAVQKEEVLVVFDDNVEQHVPKTWVCHRARPWTLQIEVGSVADIHYEVGDDGRRSTNTDIGIILSEPMEGRAAMGFLLKLLMVGHDSADCAPGLDRAVARVDCGRSGAGSLQNGRWKEQYLGPRDCDEHVPAGGGRRSAEKSMGMGQ